MEVVAQTVNCIYIDYRTRRDTKSIGCDATARQRAVAEVAYRLLQTYRFKPFI